MGRLPMKSLQQLIERGDSAFPLIREWLSSAKNDCVLLAPSTNRAEILLQTQVSTRSTMGAIAYETGGVLIDHGWLRVLGSSHPRLVRTLSGWNENKTDGCYLIADDAAGGFFAVNSGAFGSDMGKIHYWPPDSLEWEPIGRGYSDFLEWALSGDLAEFYATVRWSNWREDVASLSTNRCIAFHPFLWSGQGSPETSRRSAVPVEEAFMLKQDILRQIHESRT
jgi:Protein of unknown function DUF2625